MDDTSEALQGAPQPLIDYINKRLKAAQRQIQHQQTYPLSVKDLGKNPDVDLQQYSAMLEAVKGGEYRGLRDELERRLNSVASDLSNMTGGLPSLRSEENALARVAANLYRDHLKTAGELSSYYAELLQLLTTVDTLISQYGQPVSP